MTSSKYTATVNDQATFGVCVMSESEIEVDGQVFAYDFEDLGNGEISLILNGSVYSVQTSRVDAGRRAGFNGSADTSGRTLSTSILGHTFNVRVDDERSLLLSSFSGKSGATTGTLVIHAPMPGLISRIEVSVGEEVSAGTGLLVLEAMKMENEIRSTSRGRIESISVERGKAVEKGESLLTIVQL